MSPLLSTILSGVFLLLGAAAVVSMMARMSAREAPPSRRELWIHRLCGWSFTALFLALFVFMVPRVDRYWEEAAPRINLHMALAQALIVLLALKLSIPRLFPALRKHLFLLGAGLYAAGFTMVLMTGGYFVIRAVQGAPYISHGGLPESMIDTRLGMELFITKCSTCHMLENIMKPRSPAAWEKVVNDMVALAAPRIGIAEARQILHYLTTTHAPRRFSGPDTVPPTEKYCLPCHRASALASWRNSEAGWRGVVLRMREYDPETIPEDKVEDIVAYLVKTQGLD